MYINFNKPLKEIEAIVKAVKQGYGGVYHDGAVDDIRKDNNHSMRAMPYNKALGIPKPKERIREKLSNTSPKT